MKAAVDQLTDTQKQDRVAVFDALGSGLEDYVADVIRSLVLNPTPALQVSTTPGSPTAPAPAPIPFSILVS